MYESTCYIYSFTKLSRYHGSYTPLGIEDSAVNNVSKAPQRAYSDIVRAVFRQLIVIDK